MAKSWLLWLVVVWAGCSGTRPLQIGVSGGRLATCPASPNCVSSQSTDDLHAIEPLRFDGEAKQAWQRLIEVIRGMEKSRLVSIEKGYLHAEFTSALFRFVDDAEFLLDKETKMIHVRSAARIGYSDLGVNRKRIEMIRTRFTAPNG
jgi:uncharacterized protein (DUF1499 family)